MPAKMSGMQISGRFLIAEAALKAVETLGMPECRIALAQATEFVARTKKSNRAIMAIDEAMNDIRNGLDFPPPMHLRDAHYKDAKKYDTIPIKEVVDRQLGVMDLAAACSVWKIRFR